MLPRVFSALLLFAVGVLARCTINYNNSFAMTTYNSANPALNGKRVDIYLGTVGISQPSGSSVIPYFSDGGIYRYGSDGVTVEQGYLQKRPGTVATGWVFVFNTKPPADAIKERFEIGCNEAGRHILSLNGELEWQACALPKGEYTINKYVTDDSCADSDVRFWIDYIRPV